MIDLISKGIYVFVGDLGSALTVLVCMLWGSIFVVHILRRLDPIRGTAGDYFSLAMGGWLVPVLIAATPIFLLGALLDLRLGLGSALLVLVASLALLVLLVHVGKVELDPGDLFGMLALVGLFALMGLIRLAFVARTPLPLYFDSAEHYRIIQSLAQQYAASSPERGLAWPVSTYYHIGSHLILALLSHISQRGPGQMMLVAGQLILSTAPLALFAIVRRTTQSTVGGVAAAMLGSFGWYMPAFAANWGKYPAIFSLPTVLFCIAVGQAALEAQGARRRVLLAIALVGAAAATALQSRSLVLLIIVAAAAWIANRWSPLAGLRRHLGVGLALLILAIEGTVSSVSPVLAPVLDPYVASGPLVTLLVVVLSVPAFGAYPRLAFACLATVILLLLSLYLPVPGFALTPLLDRPLVEMVLFAPLSILGAAGLAGLTQYLSAVPSPLRVGGIVLVFLAIAVNSLNRYSYYPSSCCALVGADDLVALDWIDRNLAPEARIAIAQTQLDDAPAPYPPLSANTDAGAWIMALTGRPTIGLPHATDFRQQETLDTLCSAGVAEIYVTGPPQGFDRNLLDAEPTWYELQLMLPAVRIYRLAGCGP